VKSTFHGENNNKIKTMIFTSIAAASILSMTAVSFTANSFAHEGNDGCTPGFWKNKLEVWPISTDTTFADAFGIAIPDKESLTLLEMLNAGGGGVNAMFRAGAAAYLNAAYDSTYGEEVFNYPKSTSTVVRDVLDGLDPKYELWSNDNDNDLEARKDSLDAANNLGGPICQ
jgi:hypothetical protein